MLVRGSVGVPVVTHGESIGSAENECTSGSMGTVHIRILLLLVLSRLLYMSIADQPIRTKIESPAS